MKRKHAVAAANKKAMREGYRAVEDALQSLADQAQDLRMGYEPMDEPERIFIGEGNAHAN